MKGKFAVDASLKGSFKSFGGPDFGCAEWAAKFVLNLVPLIAIQVNAYKFDEHYFLTFTTVLDEMQLGFLDEDEAIYEPADRNYWEIHRRTKETVKIVDKVLKLIADVSPGYALKYNKFYIGLETHSQTDNFVIFKPQRNITRMEARIPQDKVQLLTLD